MWEERDEEVTPIMGVVERQLGDGEYQVRLDEGLQTCHIGLVLRRAGVGISEGDRVTIRAEEDGVFRGEITQVRHALLPVERPARRRSASLVARAAPTLRPEDQKVDHRLHPGWLTGAERLPAAGDAVYCTAGLGTVLRVLGRTGNGSRLIEIRIPDQPRASFFAAASNVLLEPVAAN